MVRPAVSARDAACGGGFPLQVAPLQPRPHWHPTAPPRLYRPCASAVTWDPRPGVAGPSSHSQAMTLALQTSLMALLAVVGSRLLTVQEHRFGPGRSPPPPPCRPPGFCSRLPPAPGPRLSFSFSRSSVGVSVTIRSLCPLQPHASWGFRVKRQHRGARRPLADQQGRGCERLAPSPAWVGPASLDHPQPPSQAGGPGGRCGAELGASPVEDAGRKRRLRYRPAVDELEGRPQEAAKLLARGALLSWRGPPQRKRAVKRSPRWGC
ncbi:uncharacterized protein LOC118600363 isoform X1 [Rousettus aegyptiacus]|uniref:uncharacterized protein LOC118600363 isoform X1 n=1 Tax=Rousettus aegyptiacus TaxID=9407 RepID=UPI00168CC026|nr:uncharacterized protein LOC118600363 isoform X1 [Rousettus aegyptiacus]